MKRKYVKDYIPDDLSAGSYRYVGEYYQSSLSKEARKRAGKRQLIFGVITLLFLVFLLFIPSIGTRTLYVVIPMEIMMVCFVCYCIGSFSLLTVSDVMEKRFYHKAYESPIQLFTVSLILEFLSLSGQALGVLHLQGSTKADLLLLAGLSVHFIVSIFLWNRQRKEMDAVEICGKGKKES